MTNAPSRNKTLWIAAAAVLLLALLTAAGAAGLWYVSGGWGDLRVAASNVPRSYCDNAPWTPCAVPSPRGGTPQPRAASSPTASGVTR